MRDGVLPNHTEYEEGILGAVINDPAFYREVSTELVTEDFYAERNRAVFCAMGQLSGAGAPIHIVTLWERLGETGALEDAGGSSYLTYLSEVAFLDDKIDYYVNTVRDDSERRRLWMALMECAESVRQGGDREAVGEIISKLSRANLSAGGSRLKPVSMRDLDDVPPPASLWADILYPGCIVQLNSEPGAGKSTFAYNICALGACGRPFLDIPFSKRLRSLYVDLETPAFLRRNKTELICGELPADFHVLDSLDLRSDFTDILALCKRERYDLMVLDTQSRVLAMEKENDNSEANYLAGLLRRIANEAGCAILLIHHTTKGDEGKAVYRGRGASAIAGAVDVVVNMQTLSEDVLKLSVVKHRIQGSNPTLLIRKAGEDRFEKCEDRAGEESGFMIYRVQDAALSMLTDADRPLATGEIAEHIGRELNADRRTIFRALGRLAQSGKVSKPMRGFYEIRRES